MELLEASGGKYVFQVSRREKRLLLEALKLYPVLPVEYHRLAPGEEPAEGLIAESQALLQESLSEKQRRNREELDKLFGGDCFTAHGPSERFTLEDGEVEWLLEILNDVRVGSWVRLGCPDERTTRKVAPGGDQGLYLLAMDICAFFQTILLAATAEEE